MKLNPRLMNQLPTWLRRYRYPLLILLAGVVLMLIPLGGGEPSERSAPTETAAPAAPEAMAETDYCAQMEQRLADILSRIDGAGEVKVMLTLKSGATIHYQTDTETRTESGDNSSEDSRSEKTVLMQRGSAYNEPAVIRTDDPQFRGALIVSSGGNDPAVRYALTAAVSALLGLGADQITIVKMK